MGTVLLRIVPNFMNMMGILCCVCCYGAKLGLGASIVYKLCLFYWYNVVKLNWYDLDYVWVSGAVFVCVK